MLLYLIVTLAQLAIVQGDGTDRQIRYIEPLEAASMGSLVQSYTILPHPELIAQLAIFDGTSLDLTLSEGEPGEVGTAASHHLIGQVHQALNTQDRSVVPYLTDPERGLPADVIAILPDLWDNLQDRGEQTGTLPDNATRPYQIAVGERNGDWTKVVVRARSEERAHRKARAEWDGGPIRFLHTLR